MRQLGKFAIIACVAAMTSLPPAIAADIPEPIPVIPVVGAWYLRGDIGYKWYRDPDGGYPAGQLSYISTDLDNTGIIGGGIGYRFNDWFRSDLTVDYEWKSDFYGQLECPGVCAAPGYSEEFAEIDAWTFLFNIYGDLGTWNSITPYIGGGIGGAYVRTSNISFINPGGGTGTWGGDSRWNFAWALMAGTAIDISHNWALDFNYRYVDLGKGVSGAIPIGAGGTLVYDDIAAHEIRAGLRYTFGAAGSTPVVANF